jgi:hypothetical protein
MISKSYSIKAKRPAKQFPAKMGQITTIKRAFAPFLLMPPTRGGQGKARQEFKGDFVIRSF